MKMWSGRFREPLDHNFEQWQRSLGFDWQLLPQEVAASKAHARTIAAAGILTEAELGKIAEEVRTVACNVTWTERFRTSSKTRQRHELSGFMGEATYQGYFSEHLSWLLLGELVHIGKHTAWGNGWIELGKAQHAE